MDKLDDMEKRDKIKNWEKIGKYGLNWRKKYFLNSTKKTKLNELFIGNACKQSNLEDQDVQ